MGKSLNGKELGAGIVQRKDGRYQARYIDRFGKRQSLYADTVTEITKLLRDKKYEDEKQLNVIDANITLDEWFEKWITTCKKHCRDTTLRTYRIQYERLRKSLGWRKLNKITLIILQDAFNELKSDASRSDCKALIIDMFNRAVETEMLVKNVAFGIKTVIDNEEQEERHVLSDEEIQLLLAAPKTEPMQNLIIVALSTGLRIGELLGLTWDSVDFKNKLIKIDKTLAYLPNNGKAIYEFHKPKTAAGKREIPMTQEAEAALVAQRRWKDRVEVRHNPRTGLENLVFCSKTNNPIHETNVRRALNEIVNKINRDNPDIHFEKFTPHCLRHTFATKCIARGMKPKTLQKILGHNSLQMTMDLYCHVEECTIREEMARIGSLV